MNISGSIARLSFSAGLQELSPQPAEAPDLRNSEVFSLQLANTFFLHTLYSAVVIIFLIMLKHLATVKVSAVVIKSPLSVSSHRIS